MITVISIFNEIEIGEDINGWKVPFQRNYFSGPFFILLWNIEYEFNDIYFAIFMSIRFKCNSFFL